jgi:hypothetical protein
MEIEEYTTSSNGAHAKTRALDPKGWMAAVWAWCLQGTPYTIFDGLPWE